GPASGSRSYVTLVLPPASAAALDRGRLLRGHGDFPVGRAAAIGRPIYVHRIDCDPRGTRLVGRDHRRAVIAATDSALRHPAGAATICPATMLSPASVQYTLSASTAIPTAPLRPDASVVGLLLHPFFAHLRIRPSPDP